LANKLSINIKKSNYFIFRPRQKRETFDIKVTLSNISDIIQVKETVFIGEILNEDLTWIPHLTNVARKVLKTVGVMYKASFCLSKRSLITLYYSLLYPYLQYCVSVWGSTYPSTLNRTFMLQKRADLIVKNLKILKFNCIYLFQIGKLMGQLKNGLLSRTFDSKFALNSQVHNYRYKKLKAIPYSED